MYCQGMCYVMFIILSPSNSCHNQPQYAHFISRLLCVISAQQRVAQCRRSMDSSWHTQQCIFQFLWAEGARPADFCSWIKHVYGTNVCSIQQCLTGARDSNRVCPGCQPHVMDPDIGANVDQMVQCDHFATLWHISEHLSISVECVHHIITQVLG
jgi:hypothetical protein